MPIIDFLFRYRDDKFMHLGLVIIRVGVGITIMLHGLALFGGPKTWAFVGKGAWALFGVTSSPAFWGFCAKFVEFFGGICLILGLFVTPAAILLSHNMVWAVFYWLAKDKAYPPILQPIENGIVFFSLIFLGPGKYSLDHLLFRRLEKGREAREA
jgi:putative oxidoreductase